MTSIPPHSNTLNSPSSFILSLSTLTIPFQNSTSSTARFRATSHSSNTSSEKSINTRMTTSSLGDTSSGVVRTLPQSPILSMNVFPVCSHRILYGASRCTTTNFPSPSRVYASSFMTRPDSLWEVSLSPPPGWQMWVSFSRREHLSTEFLCAIGYADCYRQERQWKDRHLTVNNTISS